METNEIKFTSDEQAEMAQLNGQYQNLLLEFGELHLRSIQLKREQANIEEDESDLSETYSDLQKKETDLMSRLQKKYGPGSPDLVNGVYVREDDLKNPR